MKRKMLMVTLAVVLCAALAGGATMAWFTDTATNEGNTFKAGTVEIELQGATGELLPVPLFTFSNIAPGWVSSEQSVRLQNTGTLDLAAVLRAFCTFADASGRPGSGEALYKALEVKIAFSVGPFSDWIKLDVLDDSFISSSGIFAGTGVPVHFMFRLPENTGNAAQGGTVTLNLAVRASQFDPLGRNNEWLLGF